MADGGFIQDQLEIKLLILYIASRLSEPVPFETMQELAMCDNNVSYFEFSACLADLVKTEHLRCSPDRLYEITEKGRRNGEICESGLPYSIRLRCDQNVEACNRRLRRKSQVQAAIAPRDNGMFTLTLSLSDDMGSVMNLQLLMVREDMAELVKQRFLAKPEQIYNAIIRTVFAEPEREQSDSMSYRE